MNQLQGAVKVLRGIARREGLRVRVIGKGKLYTSFTGKTIQVSAGAWECLSDIAHELAHYFVAPPEYKHLAEFGWASSYLVTYRGAGVRQHDSDDEEALASALGIWMLRHIGADDVAIWTFDDHGWIVSRFRKYTKALLSGGHLEWRDGRLRVSHIP